MYKALLHCYGFVSFFWKPGFLQKLKMAEPINEKLGLEYYQKKVFYTILSVSVIATAVCYIPSTIAAYNNGHFEVILIDTVFMLWIFYLFFSRRLSLSHRISGLCNGLFVLSALVLIFAGPNGGIILWLYTYPLVTVVFGGLKKAKISLVIVISFLILLTILKFTGVLVWQFYPQTNSLWLALVGSFILLSLIVTNAIGTIYKGLEKTIGILENQIKEIKKTHKATIECLAALAEYNDSGTGKHINRTQQYVKLLAGRMLKEIHQTNYRHLDDIDKIAMSAPLHDVGKVGVSEMIINKPGKLTEAEFEEIKKHTIYGMEVLEKSEVQLGENSFLTYARQMAHSHHEKWDGSGYPLGLKGENIPLPGRIMAVADVYDALRSRRSYKTGFTHKESKKIIMSKSGSHFDPDVVKAFLELESEFERISDTLSDENHDD